MATYDFAHSYVGKASPRTWFQRVRLYQSSSSYVRSIGGICYLASRECHPCAPSADVPTTGRCSRMAVCWFWGNCKANSSIFVRDSIKNSVISSASCCNVVKTHGFCNSNAAGCVMVISFSFSSNLQCTLRKNVPFSFSVKPLRYDELINLIIACYRKMHSIGHSCPQGNSLCLLYALGNKFAVFSQVYST